MAGEEYEIRTRMPHARLNAQPKQMNTVYKRKRKTKQPLYLVSWYLGIWYLVSINCSCVYF